MTSGEFFLIYMCEKCQNPICVKTITTTVSIYYNKCYNKIYKHILGIVI